MLSRVRITSGWPPPVSPGQQPLIHCLSGREDLTPPRLTVAPGGWPLDKVLMMEPGQLKATFGKWRLVARSLGCHTYGRSGSIVCCKRTGDDLVCVSGTPGRGEARAVDFYASSHLGYHLFDSFQKKEFLGVEHIEWSNLTVAPLYRRALGLTSE